jgi:hypothetical protein
MEKKVDGTYNVKLRFTLGRKIRRRATSLFVTPKDLTKELKIKDSSPIVGFIDIQKFTGWHIEVHLSSYLIHTHEYGSLFIFVKQKRGDSFFLCL